VTAPTLAERIVALDVALAPIPHAFGGALALAYYAEPRATIDIDLNVFVTVDQFPSVAAPLNALGADADDPLVTEQIRSNGQARVMWDGTPIDLFFAYDRFHDAAAAARRIVPFADREIPILAVEHLIICKVVFNRPKDWVDIDAIVAAGTPVDIAEVLRWVGRILGDEAPRYDRVASVLMQRE
jgi:Nucleotidyl transferase AbiEii toxin, Type IV TA system